MFWCNALPVCSGCIIVFILTQTFFSLQFLQPLRRRLLSEEKHRDEIFTCKNILVKTSIVNGTDKNSTPFKILWRWAEMHKIASMIRSPKILTVYVEGIWSPKAHSPILLATSRRQHTGGSGHEWRFRRAWELWGWRAVGLIVWLSLL